MDVLNFVSIASIQTRNFRRSMRFILILAVISILAPFELTRAQLSPGDLAEPHSALEGLKNCERCHEAGKQISAKKCLDCHKILNARIKSKKGLHANPGYEDCTACHVEHLGSSAELIWWRDGMDKFDHRLTGFELSGKHAKQDCRKCHTEKNVVDKQVQLNPDKNLNTTFLGLSPECTGCHIDEHRGQLTSGCNKCHTAEGWKSALKFDHGMAAFKLTGKHVEAPCVKCHPTRVDNRSKDDPDYLQFMKIQYSQCVDCHQIYHKSDFSRECQKCHSTAGWKKISASGFSHATTHFPLEGKHQSVACEKCHLPGKPLFGLRYSLCTDCHKDYHLGQFARRESKGECGECHTTAGFSPSTFTIEKHNLTKYKLEGSHLAIPCVVCHRVKFLDDGSSRPQFAFTSTRCKDCHADPHKGDADRFAAKGGCEFCHSVEAWQQVNFDHDSTKFSLVGRHRETACRSCHKPETTKDRSLAIKFLGLQGICSNCHQDRHRGQFASISGDGKDKVTDCGRCHSSTGWIPTTFDHNRDSAYKLDGAHLRARCTGCHKSVGTGDDTYILYKKTTKVCEDCHGGKKISD